MDFVFPGYSRSIWLLGLLLSFIGSTLIAFSRTNKGEKRIERITDREFQPQRFGQLYLEREGEISEDNKSPNHEDSFSGLVEFILSMSRRGEYMIPSCADIPVARITLEETWRRENEVVIEWAEEKTWTVSGGKRSETDMSIDDLGEEVENAQKRERKKNEDASIRYSWELFAVGVLLQMIAFISVNFVVW